MIVSELRKEIHRLLVKPDIHEAFTYIGERINPESSIYDELIVVQGTFNLSCKNQILDLIAPDAYKRDCSRAATALLQICRKLVPEDFLFRHPDATPQNSTKDVPPMPDDKKKTGAGVNDGTGLATNSRRAHYHIVTARKLRQDNQLTDGIIELRQAAALRPYSYKTKTDLAALLRLTHQHDEAVTILQTILEKYPHDSHSRNELATCYRETDALYLAVKTLYDGLKLVNDSNHFHTNLFIIHLFFSCEVAVATLVKEQYALLTNAQLIRDTKMREKYDAFIFHFEDIHCGRANQDVTGSYLDECINVKRAYRTAVGLLTKLLKVYPDAYVYKRLCRDLPPQYRVHFRV